MESGKGRYKPVLDLKIRRFVTTNYDLELESALHTSGEKAAAQLVALSFGPALA